jgi:hypothetical protein
MTDDDTKPQIVSSLHSSFQGQKTNTPPNFPNDINGRLDKDQKLLTLNHARKMVIVLLEHLSKSKGQVAF